MLLVLVEDIFYQLEERRDNLGEEGSEVFLHDKTQSLPARQQVSLLGVSRIQLALLDLDHERNQLLTSRLEGFPAYCMCNQSKTFNQLSSHLSIFFPLVGGQHVEQELAHFCVELGEFLSSSLGTGGNGCKHFP